MRDTNNTASYFASALSGVIGFLQQDEVMQWLAFMVAIASGVFSIAYTIFKMVILYKEAKEDGKVTIEELEAIRQAGQDGLTSSQLAQYLRENKNGNIQRIE